MMLKLSWRKSNLREYFSELISVGLQLGPQMSQDCVPKKLALSDVTGQ